MSQVSSAAPGVTDAHPDSAHRDAGHVEHHFATAAQQFDAAKLGMWLFLATEILLFAGLFCAYAVYRRLHPDIFAYGSQFLDARWGGLNTVVLITSSFTMALAVHAAQHGQRRKLLLCLQLTFLGGVCFLGIKYVEYKHKFDENLVWGARFYTKPSWLAVSAALDRARTASHREPGAPSTAGVALLPGDSEAGVPLWNGTCRSCHGPVGEGMPNEGKAIAGGEFIRTRTDDELLAYVKVGRTINDPANTTKKAMPPKGGNPLLTDQDIMHVIAFLRTLPAAPVTPTASSQESGAATTTSAPAAAAEFYIPRSVIPNPPPGPPGLAMMYVPVEAAEHEAHAEFAHHTVDPACPPNAHVFFGIYFFMTGLHGLHVIAGMAVIVWLIVRTARGDFTAEYYTPVDLGGLYWHLVDLIWIYLFPLLYLIG